MSKIYCYSLDFHKKEKEFLNIDDLLKNIVGAKEQAEKALNNPELSYRGFRLISEDKLNTLLPIILSTKSEKIKNDYVDNIADLEGKIKKLEKSERKSSIKMDVLKDDHNSEIENLKNNYIKDKEKLIKEHEKDISDLQKESDINIQSITDKYMRELAIVKKEKDQLSISTNDAIEKYTKEIRIEISEYNKKLAVLKDTHNAKLEKIYQAKESEFDKILNNKELFINKMIYNLDDITKTVNELTGIINVLLDNENKEMGTFIPKINNESIRALKGISKNNEQYLNVDGEVLHAKVDNLFINPLMITSTFDTDVIEKSDVDLEFEIDSIKKVEIKKEEPQPEPIKLNGVEILEEKVYEKFSNKDKINYLIDITNEGVDLQKLANIFPSLEKDLNNKLFISEIISISVSNNKKYLDIKKLVKEPIAKELAQTIIPSKSEYNTYFGISELAKTDNKVKVVNKKEVVDSVETIIEQDRNSVRENKDTVFDWAVFKGKYVRTDEMKLLFGRESISLREAGATIQIPSDQIKRMMGTLKALNYNRKFNNNNLLTPDELLLFIVSDGWYRASLKRGSGESLQSIIKKLYPSWLEFISK